MFSSDKWFGAEGAFYPKTIDQSLRFEDGDSPYLYRTPSSAGNRRTFTWSGWYKRANLTTTHNQAFFSAGSSSSDFTMLYIDGTTDDLRWYDYDGSTDYGKAYDIKLRDTTNWYHIVYAFDTTQATASDRVKVYVNGTQLTSILTDYGWMGQNYQTRINDTKKQNIAKYTGNSQYIDGYLAEVNFIDGTALDPTSFGETKNGVWIPKAISGLTYGTNGFRLTFADSSSLGDDTSGNGNDYTSTGLASTDVCTDSPTNNFSTLNSIGNDAVVTFSEGNLKASVGANTNARCEGTFAVSSGKWYWEVNVISYTTAITPMIGIKDLSVAGHEDDNWNTASVYAYYGGNGNKYNSGSSLSYGATYTTGDIIGVALDLDAGTLTFYKNGSSQGTAYSSLTGEYTLFFGSGLYAWVGVVNFGQDGTFAGNETAQGNADENGQGDFYYTVPSGHLALCSSNLPDTTLSPNQNEQADDYFNTVLYTGNDTARDITVGFATDWVWTKIRSAANSHYLFDSSRGVNKALFADGSFAEDSTTNRLTAFNSDGFSLGTDANVNSSSYTYVAWNWKANGGTTSSNTDGSITSTVQASTKAGFSIVLWTGEGDSQATVGHGLGAVPKVIIPKIRGTTGNWHMYHAGVDASAPEDYGLLLNAGNARSDDAGFHNDTAPTSSVFTVGTYNNFANTYVAYCFAEVEGFSKFGSYESNNSSDGTFVYTGFRPAWVMTKDVDRAAMVWMIYDNKRDTFNEMNNNLVTGNSAEPYDSSNSSIDFTSNGFKFRDGSSSWNNYSTETYVYMAFAEQPFKFSNAR